MHLVIDGFRGDIAKMWDAELVRNFLIECPDRLGMTRITDPKVLDYQAPKSQDSGVSGFVIIAESHISIHTFPRRNYVNIDIFSCLPFDHEKALSEVKSLFDLEEVKTWLLDGDWSGWMSAKVWLKPWGNARLWKLEARVNTMPESGSALPDPFGEILGQSSFQESYWVPRNFLALPPHQSSLDKSKVVVIPVPYDSTTSFRSGAREGPAAMIQASYGIEDYDAELQVDVSQLGIYTTPFLEPHMGGPEQMKERVQEAVGQYLGLDKMVGVLGGEHSVTVGSVFAHLEAFPDLSVLYLDAHADLREEYLGTKWGHASGARRIHGHCPLVLAGIRSLCQEEQVYITSQKIPYFPWPPSTDEDAYLQSIVDELGASVYVSIDLDVLDPALMPSVGTPEPGGLTWREITALVRAVARSRRIVGFDVCELLPEAGPVACSYTAAKLVYKLIAYANRGPDGVNPPGIPKGN